MTAASLFDVPTMLDVEHELVSLARNRGDYGVTADDLVRIMRGHGLAWSVGRTEQRRFSATGPYLADMARRGLLAAKRYPDGAPVTRKSERKEAHSNRQQIYLAGGR